MSAKSADLWQLTRNELYLIICELRRENNCLKTDLFTFQLLLNKYEKHLNSLQSIQFNDDFIKQIKNFNAIKAKNCFISLSRLDSNQTKSNQNAF